MEYIILAGGLGTRLRSVTKDVLPKSMAPINGKPFLHYLLKYCEGQAVQHIILSLGYQYEAVLSWIKTNDYNFPIDYVVEREPLGTGGGMQLALTKTKTTDVGVLNGDTLFSCSLKDLFEFHKAKKSATTIGLKLMKDFERYGSVKTDNDQRIISFEEKNPVSSGFINAGVYIINKDYLLSKKLPEKFSFEKDFLETFISEKKFFGKEADNYSIDIGIPEDYYKAQSDFIHLFS